MEYNELLYGHDRTERIVGIAPHGNQHVRLWMRNDDGTTHETIERVHPWLFTDDTGIEIMQESVGPHAFKVKELTGENEMNRLAVFPNVDTFRSARKPFYAEAFENFFTYGDQSASYLTHSGRTMFKGMTPENVHQMQIDIEAYRLDGFPDSEQDPIFIVSMCDNRGWEKALYWRPEPVRYHLADDPHTDWYETEAEMLRAMVEYINRRDPDILMGHNIFGFDLPYIAARCEILGVHFAIGRDGRPPYTYEAEKKFAERDFKYTNFLIGGRTVIDTMFLAIDWDVYTRKLENVTLKGVAKTLGVAPEGREYIEGDQIAATWDSDPARVLRYAMDDVYETRGIGEQLISSQFALTQMMPLPFQKVHLAGKASVIQSLFVREYLRKRESLPTSKHGQQEWGGYTDVFQTGIFEKIWYIDVASLYPSIMLNYDIKPEQDSLNLFQTILKSLTDLRFQTKGAMKTAKTKERLAALDARQQAFKIIINSFYGMLGAGGIALFATISEADRVARTGQGLLRRMMEIVAENGADIIECDTDGILAVCPPDKDFYDDGPAFCKMVSAKMPPGIIADFDGAYETMMSLKKKNYALKDVSGKVRVKGGSLKSRSLEPLFRDYVTDTIDALLNKDVVGVRRIYREAQERIVSGAEPHELARAVTLKVSLKEYQTKVDNGMNRAPQYEIALDLVKYRDRRVQKGDKIRYVVCGTKPISRLRSFVDATVLEEVQHGTHHRKFYLKRLLDIAVGRFGIFFALNDVQKVFPKTHPTTNMDLFGAPVFAGVPINNTRIKSWDESPIK